MLTVATSATPCDQDGEYLPPGTPPPTEHEDVRTDDWTPFNDRPSFQLAWFSYRKAELSGGDIDELMEIWAAHTVQNGGGDAPFLNKSDMYATIDNIQKGDAPWKAFSLKYDGPLAADSPSWKCATYRVFCRDTRTVAHNMLSSSDFDGRFDYRPFQEYLPTGSRRYSNVMSGDWAYKQSVSSRS